MIALWLWGCSSPEPEAPVLPPPPDHAGEWSALVRAAARGDRAAAQVMARDLSLGSVSDDHAGATAVGAGLGFVQVATDDEDVALGLGRAGRGCAACHAGRAVPAPAAPSPNPSAHTHEHLLELASWGAVWGQAPACPADAPEPVCARWSELGAVVEACQSCHASR